MGRGKGWGCFGRAAHLDLDGWGDGGGGVGDAGVGSQQVEKLALLRAGCPVARLDDDLHPVLAAQGRRFERLRLHGLRAPCGLKRNCSNTPCTRLNINPKVQVGAS